MGMTIDKTIEFFNGLECHTPQAKDARDVAVNTMRKYQQIEQMVKQYKKFGNIDFSMQIICGVVEDGTN